MSFKEEISQLKKDWSLSPFKTPRRMLVHKLIDKYEHLEKERDLYREALKNIAAEPDAAATTQGLFLTRECAREALEKGDKIRDGSAS